MAKKETKKATPKPKATPKKATPKKQAPKKAATTPKKAAPKKAPTKPKATPKPKPTQEVEVNNFYIDNDSPAKEKSKPKPKKETKERNNMSNLATIPKGKVLSLAERRTIYAQLKDKQKMELEPYRDLAPKKHKKFEAGDNEYSEADVKEAGKKAIQKKEREAKAKKKANADASIFKKMVMYSTGAATLLGVIRDRAQIFSRLPAIIKAKDGTKHPANDDLIIGAVTYGIAAKLAKGATAKKMAISMSLAAFNNAGRLFGANIDTFDDALKQVRAKLGV